MGALKEKIKRFLSVSYGSGDGSGSGSGSDCGSGYGFGYGDGSGYGSNCGSGYGYGSGDGSGSGSDSGSGSGYGYGYGSNCGSGSDCGSGYGFGYGSRYGFGYGIDSIDGYKVCIIDDTPTVIDIIRGNIAKGFILNTDLTLRPTYIAKCGNYFAHGETKEKAISDAKRKYEDNLPVSERLRMFNEAYPDRDRKIPASELFEWHSRLTGSCEQGRIMFCKDRGLDWRNGEYTVNEFIEITKDAYGGEVIRQLDKTKPNG